MQLPDLGAHLDAELGIEVGQRFVEQKDLGVAHDGPPHRDPLALAAGELAGVAAEKLAKIEDARCLRNRPIHLLPARPAQAQAERHVLVHRHVRVQGVVLEDHRDVPLLGMHEVHNSAVDGDFAPADLLEARDETEQGRLAAAGGPDQHHEFTVRDLDIDAVKHFRGPERLSDPGDVDPCHVLRLLLPLHGSRRHPAHDVAVRREREHDDR